MGANGAWLQVKLGDRQRVLAAVVDVLTARGARLVGRERDAMEPAGRLGYAIETTTPGWTTIVPSDDEMDFDLACALAQRLGVSVFCSETVDAALFRAEGFVGPDAVHEHTAPPNVIGERSFQNLDEDDGFVFVVFEAGVPKPKVDWGEVFAEPRDDRNLILYEEEEEDGQQQEEPEEEQQARHATEHDLLQRRALEGASPINFLRSIGSTQLCWGILPNEPAHAVFVACGPDIRFVFRAAARAGRVDRGWFDVQEAIVELLPVERSRPVPRPFLVLERWRVAVFFEPDRIAGLTEAIFVPSREARKLAAADHRSERARLLRGTRGFALAPASPSDVR